MHKAQIAIILKGYPRLSETFIAQELEALEKAGLCFIIYSLRKPHDSLRHPVHDRIKADCEYLPEYIYQEPVRVGKAFLLSVFNWRFYLLLAIWVWDFLWDMTSNRCRRLGQAVVLAAEMPKEIRHLYFHFIHTPASVTRYAAILRNLPYSGSAHAKDIWTSKKWDLSRKLKGAEWVATCTKVGRNYLQSLGKDKDKVHLIYHGLDVADFPKPVLKKKDNKKLLILSVGRLVEKKGYDYLLPLLKKIDVDVDWRFVHVGGGDVESYQKRVNGLGLQDKVSFMGALSRPDIIDLLGRADIFVLGNIIVGDGDRDGIPNVLMEALWMGVAVLAGDLESIGELIIHGRCGFLCDIRDGDRYLGYLQQLLLDADLRYGFGKQGRESMEAAFLFSPNFVKLRRLFREDLYNV